MFARGTRVDGMRRQKLQQFFPFIKVSSVSRKAIALCSIIVPIVSSNWSRTPIGTLRISLMPTPEGLGTRFFQTVDNQGTQLLRLLIGW